MDGTITLTKASLVKLLDGVLYPDPDDPGPYGPIGPVIRLGLTDVSWVMLNPQPLPPKAGAVHPDLWLSASLPRTVIDRAVAQYQLAEVTVGAEHSERITAAIGSQIRDFIDDYCGTRPPKWPLPWPPTFDAAKLRPLDLIIAGAQFQKAADSAPDSPLQTELSGAADRLFETGLRRMENR